MSEAPEAEDLIQLGNAILQNLKSQYEIEDPEAFVTDQFYFLFIKEAFPQVDFEYNEAKTPEEMAQNIDSIIEFISKDVLVDYDLSSIKGSKIVEGDIEQVANLLQILYEISKLILEKGGSLSNSKKGGSSDINSKSNRSAEENISPKSMNDQASRHSQDESSSNKDLEVDSKKVPSIKQKSENKKSPKKSDDQEINVGKNKGLGGKLERRDNMDLIPNNGNQKSEEFYTLRDILRNKRIPFTTLAEKRKIIDKYFTNCDSAPSGSNRNSEFKYVKEDSNLIDKAESETNLKWTEIFGSSREVSSQQISGNNKSKTSEDPEHNSISISKKKDNPIEKKIVKDYLPKNNTESDISVEGKSKEISNLGNENEKSNSSERKNKNSSGNKGNINLEDKSASSLAEKDKNSNMEKGSEKSKELKDSDHSDHSNPSDLSDHSDLKDKKKEGSNYTDDLFGEAKHMMNITDREKFANAENEEEIEEGDQMDKLLENNYDDDKLFEDVQKEKFVENRSQKNKELGIDISSSNEESSQQNNHGNSKLKESSESSSQLSDKGMFNVKNEEKKSKSKSKSSKKNKDNEPKKPQVDNYIKELHEYEPNQESDSQKSNSDELYKNNKNDSSDLFQDENKDLESNKLSQKQKQKQKPKSKPKQKLEESKHKKEGTSKKEIKDSSSRSKKSKDNISKKSSKKNSSKKYSQAQDSKNNSQSEKDMDKNKNKNKSSREKEVEDKFNEYRENEKAKEKERFQDIESLTKNNMMEDDAAAQEMLLNQQRQIEQIMSDYQNEAKSRIKQSEKLRIGKNSSKMTSRRQFSNQIQRLDQEMKIQQKNLNIKRDTQQILLCQKLYKLATQLEKNKLLDDRKAHFIERNEKNRQKKGTLSSIEYFYTTQIRNLIDSINQEKMEKQIAQFAQNNALISLKKDIRDLKKTEIERNIELLKQEEDKYSVMLDNSSKIEENLLNIYKKL